MRVHARGTLFLVRSIVVVAFVIPEMLLRSFLRQNERRRLLWHGSSRKRDEEEEAAF